MVVGYLEFYISHVFARFGGLPFHDFSRGLFTPSCELSKDEKEWMSRDVHKTKIGLDSTKPSY